MDTQTSKMDACLGCSVTPAKNCRFLVVVGALFPTAFEYILVRLIGNTLGVQKPKKQNNMPPLNSLAAGWLCLLYHLARDNAQAYLYLEPVAHNYGVYFQLLGCPGRRNVFFFIFSFFRAFRVLNLW